MRLFNRRTALALGLSVALAACGGASGGPVTSEDMSLGNADAKVTVIEYASAACSHCARWNEEVFPEFKTKFIDTGRVHYVFREFLTPPVRLAAGGFLLARCAGKDKYFSVIDSVFRAQPEIFQTGDMRGPLLRIAKSAGMTEDEFEKCQRDEEALKALNARVEKYQKEAKITGTPTFFVNGERLDGETSIEQFEKAIAAAEAKAK